MRNHSDNQNSKLCLFLPFCCSLAEYKIFINEIFLEDDLTVLVEEGDIVFFKDSGGETSGLIAYIYLRDSQRRIVTDYPKELPLKTVLLYEDGYPAPLKTSNGKKNLFRCMKEATLGGTWRDSCIFRIEEVSSKQKREVSGFKIKVSPASSSCSNVAAAVMEQTIYVKSKVPKTETKSIGKRPRGGRRSVLMEKRHIPCQRPHEYGREVGFEGEGDICNQVKKHRRLIPNQDTHHGKINFNREYGNSNQTESLVILSPAMGE